MMGEGTVFSLFVSSHQGGVPTFQLTEEGTYPPAYGEGVPTFLSMGWGVPILTLMGGTYLPADWGGNLLLRRALCALRSRRRTFLQIQIFRRKNLIIVDHHSLAGVLQRYCSSNYLDVLTKGNYDGVISVTLYF